MKRDFSGIKPGVFLRPFSGKKRVLELYSVPHLCHWFCNICEEIIFFEVAVFLIE